MVSQNATQTQQGKQAQAQAQATQPEADASGAGKRKRRQRGFNVLNAFIRSPHWIELMTAYFSVHVISTVLLFDHMEGTMSDYAAGLLGGMVVYTFIEYWFHRTILHTWIYEAAHKNHHDFPRKLKIITTPLLPVLVYDILLLSVFALVLSPRWAIMLNLGISIGQLVMDLVHIAEHSQWQPWFLRAARSYHHHHHIIGQEEVGHGLTTSFWDFFFGTLPLEWHEYKANPWMTWVQLPFPMFSYMIISPFCTKPKLESTEKLPSLPSASEAHWGYVLTSFAAGVVTGFNPIVLAMLG